ncbi:MAG: aspartate aminotransferase family protein, partial [Conexibacter sp.]|nr:aspartate aminotransferase family protein [Conexibacter sp.]
RGLVDALRDRRVLVGLSGPDDDVLKIRPPLVFTSADADILLSALDEALIEVA